MTLGCKAEKRSSVDLLSRHGTVSLNADWKKALLGFHATMLTSKIQQRRQTEACESDCARFWHGIDDQYVVKAEQIPECRIIGCRECNGVDSNGIPKSK